MRNAIESISLFEMKLEIGFCQAVIIITVVFLCIRTLSVRGPEAGERNSN